MKLETLERLQRARAAREPVALLTWLDSGEQRLCEGPDDVAGLPEALSAAVRTALRDDRSSTPDVEVDRGWPDEALEALAPDARTAVVTLTHDPKLDDPALRVALAGDAFYVGSLGSRRTHGARLKRLAAAGIAEDALARIHGPAGLDIGALTPAEIAAAILAQCIAALRGKPTVH